MWSDSIAPDTAVARVVAHYKAEVAPRAGEPLFTLSRRAYRSYNAESPLGDAIADAIREGTGAEIGMQNAGGIRADLPEGPLTAGNVVDVLPFLNTVDSYRMTGAQVREIVEQGLSLARGMMQLSGMRVEYDLSRPVGSRAVRITVGGAPLDPSRDYVVGTSSFIGAGGDLYRTFTRAEHIAVGPTITAVFEGWLRKHGPAAVAPTDDWAPTRLIDGRSPLGRALLRTASPRVPVQRSGSASNSCRLASNHRFIASGSCMRCCISCIARRCAGSCC